MLVKVKYLSKCGALCKRDSTLREMRFHASIEIALLGIAKAASPANKVARVALADVLLAMEVFTTPDDDAGALPTQVLFCAMVSGCGRWGRNPETLMFAMYLPHRGQAHRGC